MWYLFLIPTIVTCLLTFLFLRWNQRKQYWSQRGVPHLPPNPFLGSLNFIQRQNVSLLTGYETKLLSIPWIYTVGAGPIALQREECKQFVGIANQGLWFVDMYKLFKSPYIGIWLIWKPALIVNTPDLARRILVKDNAIFRDRYLSSGATDPIGGLNLFTVNDPLWTFIRSKLTSLFTSAKVRALHDYTYLKAKELVQRVERDHKKGLELKALFVDYTTDVVGTFSFGIESNATLTSKGPLREVTKDFMKFSVYRGLCWFSIFFCPGLVDIFRFTFFPKASMDYFKRIFQTVLAQRSDTTKKSKESKDLVDYLLDIKKQSEKNNEEISEDLLISQAAILLLGGFDTTATVLSYMVYELAFHSEYQEKLYKELKEAERRTGGHFDAQTIAELTYLNCIFKECLRKYPPMGWLDRVAAKDYQIDEKLTVKAGTVIYINCIGMQRDPDYFPEPHKFNPDRFLPENEKNIKPYTFLPFGDGPRICIGQRFSYLTGRTAASQLFLKYKVRPLPNTPKPNDLKIERKGLFLHPGEPLNVDFIPRTENDEY